jgi:hypothetical protein
MPQTEQHLFSSGVIAASWAQITSLLTTFTPTRGGSATGSVPLTNLINASNATYVDFSVGGTAGWCIIDLGAVLNITSVQLLNISSGVSPANVSVYAADISTRTPAGTGTTQISTTASITTTLGAGGTNSTFSMAAGTAIGTRYLLITLGGNPNPFDIGSVIITQAINYIPGSLQFAVCQDAQIDLTYEPHLLFTSAQESQYAIDCAFSDGKMSGKFGYAGISALNMQQLLHAIVTGSSYLVDTINSVVPIDFFTLTFTGTDSNGKTVAFQFNKGFSVSTSLPFKLKDFVIASFNIESIEDASGNIGTITYQN